MNVYKLLIVAVIVLLVGCDNLDKKKVARKNFDPSKDLSLSDHLSAKWLEYENVEIYDYSSRVEWITDLDEYFDYSHHPSFCRIRKRLRWTRRRRLSLGWSCLR